MTRPRQGPFSATQLLLLATEKSELGSAVRSFARIPQLRHQAIDRRTRSGKRVPSPEVMYADLIKAGLVRIVRRRGKPPLIQWVK